MSRSFDALSATYFDYNESEYNSDIEKLRHNILSSMPVIEFSVQDLIDIENHINHLISSTETHRYMCEQFCSNSRYDSEFYVQKFEKLEATLERLCKFLGCSLVTQNDPRGATVKLILANGKVNDWTSESYVIPIKYWYQE